MTCFSFDSFCDMIIDWIDNQRSFTRTKWWNSTKIFLEMIHVLLEIKMRFEEKKIFWSERNEDEQIFLENDSFSSRKEFPSHIEKHVDGRRDSMKIILVMRRICFACYSQRSVSFDWFPLEINEWLNKILLRRIHWKSNGKLRRNEQRDFDEREDLMNRILLGEFQLEMIKWLTKIKSDKKRIFEWNSCWNYSFAQLWTFVKRFEDLWWD